MSQPVTIRGRYEGGVFIPDGVAPMVEGSAELIVVPAGSANKASSIFDAFGKGPILRSKEDIDAQIKEEHDTWGEP